MGVSGAPPLRAPDEQGFARAPDGADIRWRRFGSGGRALLLLHGNGEDYTCFRNQIGAFSARFSVVAVDSRGHGESGRGAGVTLRRMADDAALALEAAGFRRADLVGFSDGANVGIHFALLHPDRLGKLVLAGGNLCPAGVKPSAQLPIELGARVCRLLGRFSARARKNGEILALMTDEPRFDPAELAAVRAPTLVLAGDRDLIRPEHTALIAASIPGARLRTVRHSDHFIFRNQPVQVNRLILDFLEE